MLNKLGILLVDLPSFAQLALLAHLPLPPLFHDYIL